jgi:hypothetical protein
MYTPISLIDWYFGKAFKQYKDKNAFDLHKHNVISDNQIELTTIYDWRQKE